MIKLHSGMANVRKAYHHGDLREALLEAGAAQLEAEGPAGLSLRKLGRQLGVTPGAPYRHFEDKDALLAALAAAGYRGLTAEILSATEGTSNAEERLKRAGTGYVRFVVQIIMPLAKPAIATVAVFVMIPIWNDLWWPLLISPGVPTLTLGTQQFLGQFLTALASLCGENPLRRGHIRVHLGQRVADHDQVRLGG